MNRNLFQFSLLLVAVLGASTCASQPKATEERTLGGQPCPERRVLVVRNNIGVDVEIVESRRGSGARTVIAYVGPGVQEVPIRNDYEYAYSARQVEGKTTLAATSRTRVRDHAVTLFRECQEGTVLGDGGVG